MPVLRLRMALLAQALDEGAWLVEPLLFPELNSLGESPRAICRQLARLLREWLREAPADQLFRRRLAGLPELDSLRLELAPERDSLLRTTPVTLTFPFVHWRRREDLVSAWFPPLGIEVLAEDERRLRERLESQVRDALSRRGAVGSLAELTKLERLGSLRVRPYTLRVRRRTLHQAARRQAEEGLREKRVLREVATDLRDPKRPSPTVHGRDALLDRLVGLLTGRRPRSVLLVGPSGVGKTALARALAASGRLPSELGLWSTSGSRLVSGMSGFGMWQDRCRQLVEETRRSGAVVHLDQLRELMEVGKGGCNSQGIGGLLAPSIARGELLAIAECLPEQVAIIEREEPRLLEAFAQVEVPPTDAATTRDILARVADERSRSGKPRITEPGLAALDRLHRRFATYSAAPGRPLRFLRDLLEDQPRLAPPLEAAEVTRAFSQETGLPLFMLDDSVPLDLTRVRGWFTERVTGQPGPVELVVDVLATAKAGLSRAGRPLASLLFIGPTGVGKTEMAKSLAEFLYQDSGRMIRFDMSEYAHPAAVERLIGGPSGAQGLLTQKVRDQPFTVVLLDEFEKAHPLLFDVLLQVLGEGRLTDGAGRVADFTNSVVILTSNLGAESFRRAAVGLAGHDRRDADTARHFEREVRAFLRPEMFNRIDRIVPFAPLDAESIARIARREIQRVANRDGLRSRQVEFHVDDAAVGWLAAQGHDPRYGARPLKRTIERYVVAPLAERIGQYIGGRSLTAAIGVPPPSTEGDTELGSSVQDRLEVVVTAGPPRQDADKGTLEVLEELLQLRRHTQRLLNGSVVLRVKNEIARIRQAERRKRRQRGRKRADPSTPEVEIAGRRQRQVFSPELARTLAQESLLRRLDELHATLCTAEELYLGDLYGGGQPAIEELRPDLRRWSRELDEQVFELFQFHSGSPKTLTLAIFSGNTAAMVELAQAYERICEEHPTNVRRVWLRMHREELVAGPALARLPADQRPVLRLLSRREAEQTEKDRRPVVDVYRAEGDRFWSPSDDVIGLALALSGDRSVALLQTETGKHTFVWPGGKRHECHVEAHPGSLLSYDPPADVGRVGAFSDLPPRRNYDFAAEVCEDPRLGESLRLQRRTFSEVLAEATRRHLAQRTWSMLD